MTINSTVSMLMQRPRMLLVGDRKTQNSRGIVAGSNFFSECCKNPTDNGARVVKVAFAIDRRAR
jgi:hypothetical protein